MILVDLQQCMIANLMQQLGQHQNAKLDENMLRHMVLNGLRSYKQKFKDFGEMVIACDSRRSWRKDEFPYYKANRAKSRAESEIDWNTIFESFDHIRSELKEFFPYRVIEVAGAEADDIIGVLAKYIAGNDNDFGGLVLQPQKVMIVSGDKDFKQLQKYPGVSQYDPTQNKHLKVVNAPTFLKEHIIRGDTGDGVPNFLSPDDCLVSGTRQKPIFEKKLADWIGMPVDAICQHDPTLTKNWYRNEKLIDLTFTPESIQKLIMAEYHSQGGKDRSLLPNYFISKKLKNLHEHLTEF